ncbi:MAG: hypothetical protein HRU20_10780 [Pseudomonadales bacterium]|nr:hypothetical protein [Pseudomonadales bacterium]
MLRLKDVKTADNHLPYYLSLPPPAVGRSNLMNFNPVFLKTLAALLIVLGLGCSSSDNGSDPSPSQTDNKGYNILFIGHSFFRPVAEGMTAHADRAGIVGHTQKIVYSGGASGSPQALWENINKRTQIQAILDAGDIELLGMTYHPDYPEIDGYAIWAKYALQQNPNTKFFIALPWQTNPSSMDSATFKTTWADGHPLATHAHIDTLRTTYPGNDFYCIPYGAGAAELYKLYDQENLTDVQTLISQGGNEAIFTDNFGHPDDILVTLSQVIWLDAIYQVDLSSYNYDPGYITDLKTIASDVMALHDSAYNAP